MTLCRQSDDGTVVSSIIGASRGGGPFKFFYLAEEMVVPTATHLGHLSGSRGGN